VIEYRLWYDDIRPVPVEAGVALGVSERTIPRKSEATISASAGHCRFCARGFDVPFDQRLADLVYIH
jgi:hypothetical protein